MVKTIKSIKEISENSLEPGLFLIDDGEEESQTSTAAEVAFPLAVDNRISTVLFSLEKKEDDIVSDLLTLIFSRYTDNIARLATAPKEEWDKAKTESSLCQKPLCFWMIPLKYRLAKCTLWRRLLSPSRRCGSSSLTEFIFLRKRILSNIWRKWQRT